MDTIIIKKLSADTAVALEAAENETSAVAEESTAAEEIQYEFKVTPDNFVDSLPIMGTGMLGIFIVMGVIIACVAALNKLTSSDRKAKKLEKKKAKEAAKNNQAQ